MPVAAAAQSEQPVYASADSVISHLYKSITFKDSTDLDWDTFRKLFIREATMIPVQASEKTVWSVEEYISRFNGQVKSGSLKQFKEWEIYRETDRFGDMMHIFSTYETEFSTDENPEGHSRGINSIQLVKYQGRWWITSIVWNGEGEDNPIPDEYLNNN